MQYSNPRLRAAIQGWPSGRYDKTVALFVINRDAKRGERCERVTEKLNGSLSKPKLGIYAPITRIMDGDDGKTYIVSLTEYGSISVMQGNLKYSEEYISDGDTRFAGLVDLLRQPVPAVTD